VTARMALGFVAGVGERNRAHGRVHWSIAQWCRFIPSNVGFYKLDLGRSRGLSGKSRTLEIGAEWTLRVGTLHDPSTR
jgi:hypothetical protein